MVRPIKLEKQKCAVFCKNVFISIATSASRKTEWIEDSTTATFHAGFLKRKKWREKHVFLIALVMSFKVLQCDWNWITLHVHPKYPVKTGFSKYLPRFVLFVELSPREFAAWIENRLWLWALTNRLSERSSKLACLVRMSGNDTWLSLHKNAPDRSKQATLSTEDANMKLQILLFDFTAKVRIYGV